jgi:hypothetical protein
VFALSRSHERLLRNPFHSRRLLEQAPVGPPEREFQTLCDKVAIRFEGVNPFNGSDIPRGFAGALNGWQASGKCISFQTAARTARF